MKKIALMTYILLFFLVLPQIFAQAFLKAGDKAPNFTLKDIYGKKYNLESLEKKSPIVIYFYPKAGTPGCTTEACGIRDDWSKFKSNKILVLGISVDGTKAIKEFIDNNHINFPLLSDENKKVSKEYGVLNDSGRDKRVTFIVDKSGKIADIIDVKDIPGHAAQVFEIASKLK